MVKGMVTLALVAMTMPVVRAGDYEAVFGYVQRMLSQSLKNDEAGLNATRQQLEGIFKPQRLVSKEARALNQQGLDALNRKDFASAAIAFQQAQQLDPGDIEISGNLGYANFKLNQLKRAEHQLVYTVSLSPGRTSSWYNLGQVYGAMNDADKAAGAFANAYRFSQNRVKTEEFIRQALLAPEYNETTQAALQRALQLVGIPP
jgi:cytochrome c-type biogenesis protein CcmH/NrfG